MAHKYPPGVIPPATPGATWSIRYSTPTGRVFESGFTSEALATQAREARRTDLARQRIGLPADRSRLPTIATLGDAWIERRLRTHRGAPKERTMWRGHVRPALGALRMPDLDRAAIRRYVESKRAAGLSGGTVRLHVAVISALYEDCRERPRETGAEASNPCHDLPTSIAVQLKSTTDPKTIPYVQQLGDVRRIFDALAEPIRTGYAVGVLAGLRTGEVRALRWDHLDLDRRQIMVREAVNVDGTIGPVKDSEARVLPIPPDLLAVLQARRLASGGRGFVVPPRNPGRPSGPLRIAARTVRSQTLNDALHAALPKEIQGTGLNWYRATRHTYASHYVLAGGGLHHLSRLLGHSSAEVTLRYAHLQPQRLAEADVDRIQAGLSGARGKLARLPSPEKSPASASHLPRGRRTAPGRATSVQDGTDEKASVRRGGRRSPTP